VPADVLGRAAQGRGKIERVGAFVAVKNDRAERLTAIGVSRRGRSIAVAGGADRNLSVGHRRRAGGLEGALNVQPAVPVNRIDSGRAEIVGAVEQDLDDLLAGEIGKACAINATAPLMVGAEKLVPDQRNCVPS
jgi:hypothetical protein